MSAQLKTIKEFCDNAFKKGKLIPMSFNFPAFKIDEKIYKEAVEEVVEEKTRLAIDSNKYGNHKMMPGVSYDDLVEAQRTKEPTAHQKGMMVFMEKILPVKMQNDDNMDCLEINRNALSHACVSRMKDSFMNVQHLVSFSAPWGESVSTTQEAKSKFVASMLMLKEQVPAVYKQVAISLQDHPAQHVVSELKEMEKNPDISVINQIFKIDPKFVEKHFPKENKALIQNNNFNMAALK